MVLDKKGDAELSSRECNMPEKSDKKVPKTSSNGFLKSSHAAYANPEIYMDPGELIRSRGYPFESHDLSCQDGYIVNLMRIPYGKNETDETGAGKRPVALFAHGILNSGTIWFLNDCINVIPFQLADRGYQCFILNARGTKLSRNHSKIKKNSRKYWKYGLDEIAEYDVPTVIDYILKLTQQPSLTYFGHSMGCAMLFAAASLHPELSEKIKLAIAFAPAVYLQNAKTIFVKWFRKIPGFISTASFLSGGQFPLFATTKMCKKFLPIKWRREQLAAKNMEIINYLVCGKNKEQINWEMLPVIAGHVPNPCSVRTYEHFTQLNKTGNFSKFDFGRAENLKKYGQATPPDYDLTKATFPVGLFYSDNDYCVRPENVERLAEMLPNVVLCHRVECPKFNHSDFNLAKDCDKLLNQVVYKLMGV